MEQWRLWSARIGRPILPKPAVVVSLALCALAAPLWFLVVGQVTARPFEPRMPWWIMAMLVAGCEAVVVHTQVRREVHAVSLCELACVLGLFFASPGALVLGRAVGSLTVMTLLRRQDLAKVVFNSSLYLAESMVMVATFDALRGGAGTIGPRDWLAAAAATGMGSVLACLGVSLMLGWLEGEIDLGDLRWELLKGIAAAEAVTAPSLVAVHALQANPQSAVLIAITTVLMLLGFRAYSRLLHRNLGLERLSRFNHAVASNPEVDDVLVDLLTHARHVLRAEYAEMIFLAADTATAPLRVYLASDETLRRSRLTAAEAGEQLWSDVVNSGTPLLAQSASNDRTVVAFLRAKDLRDAVLVPVPGDSGTVGTILAGNRLREVRTFEENDLRLLTTVANHAGLALHNGQLSARLRHEALHDALTGLPNRTNFNRRLAELLGSSPDGPLMATVMIVDLIDFRRINESLGSVQADQVLREVSLRMADAVAVPGVFARLGGDEFGVLVQGVADLDAVMPMILALREAARAPVQVDEIEVEVGAWIGLAMTPQDGQDPSTLMQRADLALTEAKLGGTGWHRFDSESDDGGNRKQLALVGQLRRGLELNELEVCLQPQGDLRNGRVTGAEALVRWRHPQRGLLFPDEFIPLAERNGLIGPLTSAVLERTLSAASEWQSQGLNVSVSVNLSARSIVTDETVHEVSSLLERFQLPPPMLVLEITENSVIHHPARTRAVLEQLRDLGVRLSVDDFGTGYSSLSYLRELPVHEVKIDKSFVMDMLTNRQDESIVKSIIDLAKNLGLTVVAEGVEDSHVLEALRAMGCDLIQGYYLSRPMPLTDFPAWMRAVDLHQAALYPPINYQRTHS